MIIDVPLLLACSIGLPILFPNSSSAKYRPWTCMAFLRSQWSTRPNPVRARLPLILQNANTVDFAQNTQAQTASNNVLTLFSASDSVDAC